MTIRERREAKGYTQKRLADEVGCTQTAISLIESGERNPSVKVAKRIGSILEFNWMECFDEESSKTAEQ